MKTRHICTPKMYCWHQSLTQTARLSTCKLICIHFLYKPPFDIFSSKNKKIGKHAATNCVYLFYYRNKINTRNRANNLIILCWQTTNEGCFATRHFSLVTLPLTGATTSCQFDTPSPGSKPFRNLHFFELRIFGEICSPRENISRKNDFSICNRYCLYDSSSLKKKPT